MELTLGSSRPTPETVASLPQLLSGGLAWAGGLALAVGLAGLYLRQAPAAGRLGLVGFLLALLGTAAMAGSDWTGLFVIPQLASALPGWLSTPPDGVGLAILANFVIYALGWLLFGIATLRAGVFPRAAGAAVTLGIVASIAAPLSLGLLVFELGLVWLGLYATTSR